MFLSNNRLRLYGGFCIGANVLLGLKGIALNDSFLQVAGFGTAVAQSGNLLLDKKAAPYSLLTIIGGAMVFGAGGFDHHNGLQTGFGVIKTIGATTMFYGRHIGGLIEKRVPASVRLFNKLAITARQAGLYTLNIAALWLAYEGCEKFTLASATHDQAAIKIASLTIASAGGLLLGQYHASKAEIRNEKQAPLSDIIDRPMLAVKSVTYDS